MIIQRNNTTQTLRDLALLVAENYRQRAYREKPDQWFWADELALELGADIDWYDSLPKWYEMNG